MKILVPVDGSENALRALRFAIDLVGRMREGGSLTLLNVHDDTALRHASRYVGRQAVDEYLGEMSEQDLAEAVALAGATGVTYDTEHRIGHVADEIVKLARDREYDLIAMGAKGRSSLRDLLVGSVAQRVSHTSTTAVLIVK